MKLIVGLGNPGARYQFTRHNFGFNIIDEFAKTQGVHFRDAARFKSLVSDFSHPAAEKVVLLKPQTFMNLSGEAVVACAGFYKILPQDILVLHDDLDLPLGRVRFASGGSPAGHNGIKSLIQHLATSDFARLKLGIGRPLNVHIPVVDWVLTDFSPPEELTFKNVLLEMPKALDDFLSSGLEKTMNQWNGWNASVNMPSPS